MLSGHLDRPVHLDIRDGREVVVKTYRRGGGRSVHQDMAALWRSPFGQDRRPPGLPQPISVDDRTNEVVMTFVGGATPGARDPVGRLPEVAALLADLHSSGVTVRRRRPADRILASARRKAADLTRGGLSSPGDPDRRAVAMAAHDVVALLGECRPTYERLVPSHGDFSPRNVLDGPHGLVLIDLDRLQMADPTHDLAYWGAWSWATDALAGRGPDWTVLTDLAHLYAEHIGDRGAVRQADVAFHQGAALLRIAHGWSSLQDQPAQQRLLLAEAVRLLEHSG